MMDLGAPRTRLPFIPMPDTAALRTSISQVVVEGTDSRRVLIKIVTML